MFAAHFSAFELQPLPDGASTILRMLAAQTPNWAEIALVAARDPALSLALLIADPLHPGRTAGRPQRRLAAPAGAHRHRPAARLAARPRPRRQQPGRNPDTALLRAECALHLAIETDYPRPDEAYLAGLWYGLPRSARWIAGRRPTLPALVADCGLPASLADALELEDADPIAGGAMHPLLTLLAAARRLAGADWQERIDEVAGLSGLESGSVVALRTDVGYILSGHAAYPVPSRPPRRGRRPARPCALRTTPIATPACSACSPPPSSTWTRRRSATAWRSPARCSACTRPPVLLGCGEDGRLRPLLGAAAASADLLIGELRLRLDDETSCIALGARSEQPCSHFGDGGPPGRSVADWQVARWLGQPGFHVIPLGGAGDTSVALIATASAQALDSELRWRYAALLGAAARALRSHARQRDAIAEREAALHRRFRDHVRRIAHEASNPLTVLKTRIDMLALERPGDSTLQDEMSLLNAELDRIDNLLRSAAELPAETAEMRTCRVPELLLDMRTLYGEPLFGSRQIQLELRAAREVPPAAIPASALKQVLLNLLRNASEALQPGQRLVVSVLPLVNVNGRNCLEIRFVNNGPGLPVERARDPLTPRPSAKGAEHQGLGLAVVREILAQWGGTLLCRTQAGAGTSFQIFVPLEQSA